MRVAGEPLTGNAELRTQDGAAVFYLSRAWSQEVTRPAASMSSSL
jgi:hypothetical protein